MKVERNDDLGDCPDHLSLGSIIKTKRNVRLKFKFTV